MCSPFNPILLRQRITPSVASTAQTPAVEMILGREHYIYTFTHYSMNLLQSFIPITTFIFDLDGVLTDGNILVYESGEQVRRMSVKDGYALRLAVKKKYRVAVFSG